MYAPTLSEAFNERHYLRTKTLHKTTAKSPHRDTFSKLEKPVPSPQTPVSPMNLRPPNEFLKDDTPFTRPRKLRQSKSTGNFKTRKHLIVNKDLPPLPELKQGPTDLQENCNIHLDAQNNNNCNNFTLYNSDGSCDNNTTTIPKDPEQVQFTEHISTLDKPLLLAPIIKPVSDENMSKTMCLKTLIANPFETDSEDECTMQSFQSSQDLQCHLPGASFDLESHAQHTRTGLSNLTGLLQQQITKNSFDAATATNTPSMVNNEPTETYINSDIPCQSFDQISSFKLPQFKRVSWHKPLNSLSDSLLSRIIDVHSSPEHPVLLTADLLHPGQSQPHLLQNSIPLNHKFTEGTSHMQKSLIFSENLSELPKTPPKRPLTSPPPLFPQRQARQLHQMSDGTTIFNPVSTASANSLPISSDRLSIPFEIQSLGCHALSDLPPKIFSHRKSLLSEKLLKNSIDRENIVIDHNNGFYDNSAAHYNSKKDLKTSGLIGTPDSTIKPTRRSLRLQLDLQSPKQNSGYNYSMDHTMHTHNTKHLSVSSLSTCDSVASDSTFCSFQLSSSPLQDSPLSTNSTTNFVVENNFSYSGFDKKQSASLIQHLSNISDNNTTTLSHPKNQKRLRTKYNLIRELFNTEEKFASDIGVVIDIYNKKLKKEPYRDIVSYRDTQALFTNLDQVLLLSRQFVKHLKECIPAYILTKCDLVPPEAAASTREVQVLKDVQSNIGQIMFEYIPSLEATYETYCSQSEFQLNTFYRINTQGSPIVDKWLLESREASKDKTQAWSLDALLIKPVQRLMKYPLLLKSLLDVTPQDHPDYLPLTVAIDKMQNTANRINAIEPKNFFFEASLHDEFQQEDSHLGDYNTVMSNLKNDPRCDQDLEILLVQFDRKQRHVKNLIKYLRGSIVKIQKHFDVNSALANAWVNWSSASEDSDGLIRIPKNKVYRRFAMFALPFTTSSSANVSTNKLMKHIEDSVIDPLNDMWLCYFNIGNTIVLRERYHPAYQKYVAYKEQLEASDENNILHLDSVTLANADKFLRLHNRLKNELPDLFSMTEDIIDACLVRFLAIQRNWFRVAVDSTSNVFGLNLSDIRRTQEKGDPILTNFKSNSRKSQKAHKVIDEELKICKPQSRPKVQHQHSAQQQQKSQEVLTVCTDSLKLNGPVLDVTNSALTNSSDSSSYNSDDFECPQTPQPLLYKQTTKSSTVSIERPRSTSATSTVMLNSMEECSKLTSCSSTHTSISRSSSNRSSIGSNYHKGSIVAPALPPTSPSATTTATPSHRSNSDINVKHGLRKSLRRKNSFFTLTSWTR